MTGTSASLRLAALVPPRLPRECLPRNALVESVVRALEGNVLEIVAGAGYGKTTLLLQGLDRSGHPTAWVSCDAEMADRTTLLASVAASLARIVPGFGARLRLQGPPVAQANALGNEVVETVADEVVVAIDDAHLLGPDAGGTLALLRAVLPANIHIAVTTREELGGDWLRVALLGARIGTTELCINEAEAMALAPDVPQDTVIQWLQRTEGWITGLLLAARTNDPGGRAGSPDVSSDYVAREVLSGLSTDAVRFLEDTSVLERFTPHLAGQVGCAQDDSVDICERLVARHFTSRSREGDWYRHHHLLREALLRRLASDPKRFVDAQRRAANAWQSADDPLNAARHLIAAGDISPAADAISPVAESLAMGPDAGLLIGVAEQLPSEVVAERPALLLGVACARLQIGDLPSALRELPGIVLRCLDLGDGARAAMALHRLFLAQDLAGLPHEECIRTGERFIPALPADAPMLPACLIFLASRYGFACDPDRAEEALEVATLHPAAAAMPVIGAYAAVVRAHYITRLRGDHPVAAAELMKGLDFLERNEEQDLFGLLPWAWGFEAIDKNWVGRHEEALVALDRVELWARRKGLERSMVPAVSWARALAFAGLGRWPEVASQLRLGEELDAVSATAGGMWATYRTAPAAALAAHGGDMDGVRSAIEAGLAGIATQGLRFEHPMLLCDLAGAAATAGLRETAGRLARDARARAQRSGVPWAIARAGITFAALQPETSEADAGLDDALRLTHTHHGFEELWTLRERGRAAALLARAIERGIGPAGAAARLACRGDSGLLAEVADALSGAPPKARSELADAARQSDHVEPSSASGESDDVTAVPDLVESGAHTRAPLRFTALGGFSVYRGPDEVPLGAFGRERSRAVLAALLCAEVPLHRDQLLEWFWPDLPPDRGQRAFHVALHGARRAIEPGRARRAPSVVRVHAETYRLALDAGDVFDVEEFLLAAGARDRETLERAEGLYRGDPFPEWAYEEWAQNLRARVAEARASMLERLGSLLLEEGEAREASKRFRDLLERDPEREEWHRALMRCFWVSGEVALALRQYQACRKMLITRLGTEPSPETRDLYTRILREEEPVS